MTRYQPKMMQPPAWYVPGAVGGSPFPWSSGPPSSDMPGSLTDLQAYQNQMFLPTYLTSAYPSVHMANLQQNNAMPLLTYGRHGGGPFDCSKPLAYVHPLPQALLGHSLSHVQQPNYEYTSGYHPHFRSHPYSYVRRSSSASSHHPGEPGPPMENTSSHINNHSSTGRGSCTLQQGFTTSKDRRHSRSSSNCSNRNISPSVSLNNTAVSDSLWLNDPSLLNSGTTSTTIDIEDTPAKSREISTNKLPFMDLTGDPDDEEAPKSANLSELRDDKNGTSGEHNDTEYHNMGDHPPVTNNYSAAATGSKAQHHAVGSQATNEAGFSSHSTTSLRSGRTGIETQANVLREETSPQQQRHRQQSNSLPHPAVGRAGATASQIANHPVGPVMLTAGRGLQMVSNGPLVSPGAPLSFASAQPNISSSLYMESLSLTIWQFYTSTRQTKAKYAKKVHLRNALHLVVSGVFKNAGLFIVGSSMNGFGSDESDMDMCLTVTSQDLQQKKEAFAVLSQLLPPLRKCSFIHNLNLIRAKVPILKFRDTLAGVDCDLNVNNVVGIYNTHLLAMYTRIDWRVRPLGMFVKHWAQRMDIHDGSRGRLSTYPLLLMLIHYLQASCTPPILPNLQARFPKIFNYACPLSELDMRLELPWAELRSNNPASLAELFVGFINYYTNEFDFSRWAVSVRNGAPLPIDMAIRRLPPHEQAHTARSFKVFVEEPFCQSNAARSLYDDNVLSRIRQAFVKTHQTLRAHRPLESIWVNASNEVV